MKQNYFFHFCFRVKFYKKGIDGFKFWRFLQFQRPPTSLPLSPCVTSCHLKNSVARSGAVFGEHVVSSVVTPVMTSTSVVTVTSLVHHVTSEGCPETVMGVSRRSATVEQAEVLQLPEVESRTLLHGGVVGTKVKAMTSVAVAFPQEPAQVLTKVLFHMLEHPQVFLSTMSRHTPVGIKIAAEGSRSRCMLPSKRRPSSVSHHSELRVSGLAAAYHPVSMHAGGLLPERTISKQWPDVISSSCDPFFVADSGNGCQKRHKS